MTRLHVTDNAYIYASNRKYQKIDYNIYFRYSFLKIKLSIFSGTRLKVGREKLYYQRDNIVVCGNAKSRWFYFVSAMHVVFVLVLRFRIHVYSMLLV